MRGLPANKTLEERFGRPRLLETISMPVAGTSYRSAAIPTDSRVMVQLSLSISYMNIGDGTVVSSSLNSSGLIYISANEKAYFNLSGSGETNLAFSCTNAGCYANIFLME